MIIHRYITHVLDRNVDEPVLNDFEGRISQGVDKFLQGSIKKAKKDDFLRKAKFKNYEYNMIRKICDEIIHDEKTFIENSKEIATHLFEIMKQSTYIESCDLAICLFTEKDERYVAIIKLDYKRIYNHSVEFKDDKFNIQMIENTTSISETFKPKQCAIVGVSGLNDEYDLMVIDIDAEKNHEKSVFIEDFIDAKRIIDDTYKTIRFINQVTLWINNYFKDTQEKRDAFNLLAYVMLNTSSIDINEFSERLLKNDKEAKENFIEDMKRNSIDNFNINHKRVEKKLKNISIDLMNFKMKCRLDDFNNKNLIQIVKEGESYNLVIKNIGNLNIGI